MNVLAEFLNRFLETELWLATALSLVLLTLLASQIVRMLFKHATRLAQRSTTHWDEALVNAARLPVQAVIWLVSLGWMARLLQPHWTDDADLLTAVRQLHDVGIVLCVAWFLWKFVVQVTQTAESRSQARGEAFDATTFDALSKLARLLVFVVTLLAVPLSRVNPRQGRFLKLLPAVFLYMAYLALLIAARGALDKGKIPQSLGLWWVHGVFVLIGLLLLYWEPLRLKWASRRAVREVARG